MEGRIESIDQAVDVWTKARDGPGEDEQGHLDKYRTYVLRKILFIAIFGIIAFLAVGVSLTKGNYEISFTQCYVTIWEHLTGNIRTDSYDDFIIWELWLPRAIVGAVSGMALAAAGAVMQSILRNPLADPYTTGVSSGALFGTTLAMGLGITVTGVGGYAIVVNAFIFSLIPLAVIIAVSKMRNGSPTMMIMAGLAVMYIFNAISTMIRLWLDPDTQSAIYAWSVGTLAGMNWDKVYINFVITIICFIGMMLISKRLNVLSAGDESARSIGINPDQLRIVSLLLVSLITAGTVAFTGLIGFIGLVCPHIARFFVGSDNRYLIPASGMFGAAFLTIADIVARTLLAPQILQVGVVTAFIGGPLFLYLIVKRGKVRCRYSRSRTSRSDSPPTG